MQAEQLKSEILRSKGGFSCPVVNPLKGSANLVSLLGSCKVKYQEQLSLNSPSLFGRLREWREEENEE
jgi:hypothetical protein